MIMPMGFSLKKRFSLLPAEVREQWLAEFSDEMLEEIAREEWWWTARPEQIPPMGPWFVLLYLAGRGSGKTRAGAEWLAERVINHPVDRSGASTEHLVIAPTLSDAKTMCIEGPSGLIRVLQRRGFHEVTNNMRRRLRDNEYRYVRSQKPVIIIGRYSVKIYFEGADRPDVGRGYNAASGWLDEIIKWPYPKAAWIEGIMPAMRSDLEGDHPRIFVTTTPKPLDLLYEWVEREDGSVHVVRGSTYDNSDNLSEYTLNELRNRYEGTTIGRQELYGELLDAFEGTLFHQHDIDVNRLDIPPELSQIVVGVDPSLTGEDAEMGIVVVGRDAQGHLYVLADHTVLGIGKPVVEHAWRIFDQYRCNRMVCEVTQGKEWLSQTLSDVFNDLKKREKMFPNITSAPVRKIDSKRGKRLRAQPVAMRMEQGRVHMVGRHEKLERQMVTWVPETTARTHRQSPDRLDAMVHAAWHLIQFDKRQVRAGRSRAAIPTNAGIEMREGTSGLYVPDYFNEVGRADGHRLGNSYTDIIRPRYPYQ